MGARSAARVGYSDRIHDPAFKRYVRHANYWALLFAGILAVVAVVGWVLYSQGLVDAGWYNLVPSVALASGLALAFDGTVPWLQVGILLVWAIIASAAAVKWFRFD